MQINTCGTDRIIRIAIGALLLAMAAIGILGAWAWIGVVPLATGLMGWCPLYSLLGFQTSRSGRE